ncbi:MAG: hypothetical protein ABIH41_04990 [Nanoarchaeota archaeon]
MSPHGDASDGGIEVLVLKDFEARRARDGSVPFLVQYEMERAQDQEVAYGRYAAFVEYFTVEIANLDRLASQLYGGEDRLVELNIDIGMAEALVNVVQHVPYSPESVKVDVIYSPGHFLTLGILYKGGGIPEAVRTEMPGLEAERGRGFPIMCNVFDGVSMFHDPECDQTEMYLTKDLCVPVQKSA